MLCYTGITCLDCGSDLKFKDDRSSEIIVYSDNGSSTMKHKIKECSNRQCRNHYHYSHFTRKNSFVTGHSLAKYYYKEASKNVIFMATCATAFFTSFLASILTNMMLCPEYSFYQRANAFNISVSDGNDQLDRRRLAEAFFQYALLEMLSFYLPERELIQTAFSFDLDWNLLKFTPLLKDQFQIFHAKHRCDTPGCRTVIGFDADCKVSFCDY